MTGMAHDVIGQLHKAWDGQLYLCESFDDRVGYWMVDLDNPQRRRDISTRAIGATFHRVYIDEEPGQDFPLIHCVLSLTPAQKCRALRWHTEQKNSRSSA